MTACKNSLEVALIDTEPLDVGWALDVLHPRALQPLAIGE
jgi:hypothetical protein